MEAYQLKITIKGSKPPIWRRIMVPKGITFRQLHQMIQTAFCWSDEHLYQFEFRQEGIRIVEESENAENGKFQYLVSDTEIDGLISEGKKFTYIYDFGDDWEHVIQVEKLVEDYEGVCPQVIKYKGDVIPENCGGITGYYSMAEALSPEEQAELAYDMAAVNEKLQVENGSEKEVSLAEIYDCYDKSSIAAIAKRHGMNGYSKLKKEELVAQTIEYITKPEVMKAYFLCARDTEIRLFEQVMGGEHQVQRIESEEMDFLYAGGYVTAGPNNYFLVSAEVKRAYQGFNTQEFQEERGRLSKIGDYICAANSLYAVTPLPVVLEIFNKYEEKALTEEELLKAHEILSRNRCLVEYVDGKLVDAALAEQKSYEELYKRQGTAPYYIPTQMEIRFMADNNGFLMTKELRTLGNFLSDELKVEADTIIYILHQVQAEISLGGSLQDVVDDLEAAGVVFNTKQQTERFSNIITDVWNHTRMILNRGHKPYEMMAARTEAATPQRKNTKKIYPNEPCPCGSGKKYKKCCGKK